MRNIDVTSPEESTVLAALAAHQVLLLALIVGLGASLGHVRVRGVSLGAAAVLFVAIGVSAWGQAAADPVTLEILPDIGTLGLVLFTFCIGVTSGPNFFHTLRTSLGLLTAVLGVLIAGAATAHLLGTAAGLEQATIAGVFAGALTNTPALAAAGASSGDPAAATVGYSIAYVFGVLGMLVFTQLALARAPQDTDAPDPVLNRTVRVERRDRPTIGELESALGPDSSLVFSRLRRGETGPIWVPMATDEMLHDDLVTLVGTGGEIRRATRLLGHTSSHALQKDRHYLDMRRVTISDPKVSGRTVADLDLEHRFQASLSRVRRGDVDLVAAPGVVLALGDRVRVVAPADRMAEVSRFLGDSARGLTHVNPAALGLGMALGVLLGTREIPLAGGFELGAAAGALLVGLVFGRVGRIGPVVTSLPSTAAQVMAEIGLLVFLAQAGTRAGSLVADAFTSGQWLAMALVGACTTVVVGAGVFVVLRRGFDVGGTRLSGALSGVQTQPALLAFANDRTGADPRVTLGYAMVYPLAMVAKILAAQVLGGL